MRALSGSHLLFRYASACGGCPSGPLSRAEKQPGMGNAVPKADLENSSAGC